MTKADIVEQIYEQVGFSKKESAELVEKIFEAIKTTLAEGEVITAVALPDSINRAQASWPLFGTAFSMVRSAEKRRDQDSCRTSSESRKS